MQMAPAAHTLRADVDAGNFVLRVLGLKPKKQITTLK